MSAVRVRAVIASVQDDAEDVKILELCPEGPMDCTAPSGAHVDLYLPGGMVRQYSLIGSDPRRMRLAVRREASGRGGSAFIHDRLQTGSVIEIGTPRSRFPFAPDAPYAILVGGGIGITPLLSHAQQAETNGIPWELHYACRTAASAPLLAEVRRLESKSRLGRIQFYFTRENGPRMDIARIAAEAPAQAHLYVCGPDRMTEAAIQAVAGWPASRLHLESFSNSNEIARDGGFSAILARSGIELEIPPGQTLLDAILDAGIEADHSCCEGTCGSCEVRVLDGIPDHRDVILSDAEKSANDRMMICCSGSRLRRIVIDL